MKRLILIVWAISLVTACESSTEISTQLPTASVEAQPTSLPTTEPIVSSPTLTEAVPSATAPATDDSFSQNDITLPAPTCNSLTQPQTEGPYDKANSPEQNSLYEEGMPGTRLILVGYVLDQDCNLPGAWLDGEYDNVRYRLRGHQFTDSQGRYYLETILPDLYSSRPIEHIHVKVRPEGGEEVTSQLYFPGQPVEGLTVNIEERGDYVVGYFNFVVQR